MLTLEGVEAAYGRSQVLFGVDLRVEAGQAVSLMGRNGMGKTTTLRAVMGLLPLRGGRVLVRGQDVAGLSPFRIARLGLGLVPEGRHVFPTLSVRENLLATARRPRNLEPWTLARICRLFPVLAARAGQMAATLSGGEQQMLAIGRALMTNPDLLILDEATEGLAPLVRQEIWLRLRDLKAGGLAILVVDRDITALSGLADRHFIMEKGRTVWTGSSTELLAAPELRTRHLGI